MQARFSIHPAIGIARLGNSPTSFCIASEQRGALPIDCDEDGNPKVKDGVEQPVQSFVDADGRIRRQAARFSVFVYDNKSRDGRELSIGDTFDMVSQRSGQLQTVRVDDIRWTVYLANKKASWYEFRETDGEHGYSASHQLRNPTITNTEERQRLIIDPGPRSVSFKPPGRRNAQFNNHGLPAHFPPRLTPNSIISLGDLICTQSGNRNRLLVLGGFGNSGSMLNGFGNPKIETYANNDGWFDDISDGPVSASLVCTILSVDGEPAPAGLGPAAFSVDDPAWVIVGYPRYVPEIVDIVTMDDIVFDLAVRNFAVVPYMYGLPPFDAPSAPTDLDQWRHLAKWNREFRPYFYRDIWSILSVPNNYALVMDRDAFFGGNPHDTGPGGNLDETILSIPPHEGEDPADRERRRAARQFIFSIVRKSQQENQLLTTRTSGDSALLFLMPLLCGDNPLTNVSPSKFLRLTDTMLFLLEQWAAGLFINEKTEGIDPGPMLKGPGRALDRGALSSGLGGSFCPGGEATWIMRNPALYSVAYRIHHAVPSPGALSQPAQVPGDPPAAAANLADGLEPGDLTKYSAVPWQSDFNECTNQPIDVTYYGWNSLDLSSTGDPAATRTQLVYWWPAHRPVFVNGQPWSPTAQNNSGDLQMVTAWAALSFLKLTDQGIEPADPAIPPVRGATT
jgi:hypothetical protein